MISSYGLSDIGCQRELNEDRILLDPEHNVFMVADGMGGQRCGDRAAEAAAQTFKHYFQTTAGRKEITWPFGYDATVPFAHNLMSTAIQLANRRIWRESEASTEYTGMGSTIAAVYVSGDKATIGSVGDSRVYHYRNRTLTLLTKDDSLIARLVESGAITLEEAATHPMRSVLTEAAGAKENINAEIKEVRLQPGDRLMITSDGVHGVVDEGTLRRLLDPGKPIQESAEAIVADARAKGGPDNISCVIIEYSTDKES